MRVGVWMAGRSDGLAGRRTRYGEVGGAVMSSLESSARSRGRQRLRRRLVGMEVTDLDGETRGQSLRHQ
jgi:hypothetical protein